MHYHFGEKHKVPAQRTMQSSATPSHFHITNGEIDKVFKIPATYIVLNEATRLQDARVLEKYKHFPTSYHHLIKMIKDSTQEVPIHFNKEYYELVKDEDGKYHKEYYEFSVQVNLEKGEDGKQKIPGLQVTGHIDPVQDWVIDLHVTANVPEAQIKPATCRFTVFVFNDKIGKKDVAATGLFTVLPAIL